MIVGLRELFACECLPQRGVGRIHGVQRSVRSWHRHADHQSEQTLHQTGAVPSAAERTGATHGRKHDSVVDLRTDATEGNDPNEPNKTPSFHVENFLSFRNNTPTDRT